MQNPAFWCTSGESNEYLLDNGITYGCYTVLEKPHEYVLLSLVPATVFWQRAPATGVNYPQSIQREVTHER
jgi:hypothetical protein